MLLSMAWRNLWRNGRRTLTAVSAIAGGVAVLVVMSATINSMTDRLVEAATGSMLGHAQVHRVGYREARSAALTVPDADLALEAVRGSPGVADAAGRIYGFAHASLVRGSDAEVRAGGGEEVAAPVVALVGLEPERERAVTDLAEHVVEGRWLGSGADVVLGAGLARRTGARVGDALLPTTAARSGAMRGPWAAGDEVPRVVGIVRTGIEELDSRTALLTRDYLGRLTGLEDEVHEIAIRAERAEELSALTAGVEAALARARARGGRGESVPATRPLEVVAGEELPAPGGPDAGPRPTLRLVGVGTASEPEADAEASPPGGEALVAGRWLARSEDAVLAEPLARELGLSPGDRVAVLVPVDCGPDVPDAECPPSVASFLVAGLVRPEAGLAGGRFAFVSRQAVEGEVLALSPGSARPLGADEAGRAAALALAAEGPVRPTDEVLAWDELAPEIRIMLTVFDASPVMFGIVIFLAVSIGIVNTMLMAAFERVRELGLMKALGMRPARIVALVVVESAELGAVGIVAGLGLGAAVVAYWSAFGMDLRVFMGEASEGFAIAGVTFDPVFWPRIAPGDLAGTLVPVAVMTTLSGLWPALRAARVQPTEAMRAE